MQAEDEATLQAQAGKVPTLAELLCTLIMLGIPEATYSKLSLTQLFDLMEEVQRVRSGQEL